jgi:hypothetical protein
MKFIVATILTSLIAFVAGLYLPWWSIAVAAFIVSALIHQKAWKSMLSGALGLFLLWGLLAIWIDIKNQGILSARISELLPLGGSAFLLILVTAFIGALVAGLAALSGAYLKKLK